MEVIRSVMAKELSWPGVNFGVVADMLVNCSGNWVACMRQCSDWFQRLPTGSSG